MGEIVLPHRGETVTHEFNVLDGLRDSANKQVRNPYLNLDPEERRAAITDAMTSCVYDSDFVADFLLKQVGSETWQLSLEEQGDLPARAIARFQKSFEERAANLWPFLLWQQQPEKAQNYIRTYRRAAFKLGLFPFGATLEAIPLQRKLGWRHRIFASQLMFAKSCIETPQIETACSSFLAMLRMAGDAYKQFPIEEMQQAILVKAANLSQVQVAQLTEDGLWNDKDDLAYMCIDKGLRDLVLMYYGVFRSVYLPTLSGYAEGQQIMHKKTVIHQCLRVAA